MCMLTNFFHSVQVEQLDVGALVFIRGIGRVKIVKFAQVVMICGAFYC